MKLVWSPEAIEDLISVRSHISQHNPSAAAKVVRAIASLVETQLPKFPASGRIGRVEGTRELVVPGLPFIVPYRVLPGTIEIIRVYHTSQHWPDQF